MSIPILEKMSQKRVERVSVFDLPNEESTLALPAPVSYCSIDIHRPVLHNGLDVNVLFDHSPHLQAKT